MGFRNFFAGYLAAPVEQGRMPGGELAAGFPILQKRRRNYESV
jgi:hypothetical protein